MAAQARRNMISRRSLAGNAPSSTPRIAMPPKWMRKPVMVSAGMAATHSLRRLTDAEAEGSTAGEENGRAGRKRMLLQRFMAMAILPSRAAGTRSARGRDEPCYDATPMPKTPNTPNMTRTTAPLDRYAWVLIALLCLPALVPTLRPGWFEGH